MRAKGEGGSKKAEKLRAYYINGPLGAEHSHSYIAKEQKIVCTATLAKTFDLQVLLALFSRLFFNFFLFAYFWTMLF